MFEGHNFCDSNDSKLLKRRRFDNFEIVLYLKRRYFNNFEPFEPQKLWPSIIDIHIYIYIYLVRRQQTSASVSLSLQRFCLPLPLPLPLRCSSSLPLSPPVHQPCLRHSSSRSPTTGAPIASSLFSVQFAF